MSHADVSLKEVEFVRRSEDVDDRGMTWREGAGCAFSS
jgi:hypothetical protein